MELICTLPRPHLLGRALICPDHFVEAVSAIFVLFSSSFVKSAGFFPLAGKASLVSISRAVLFCRSLECLHWSSNFGEKVVLKREWVAEMPSTLFICLLCCMEGEFEQIITKLRVSIKDNN